MIENKNPINKRWFVLIAALIMLYFSLKDFDLSRLEKLAFKDVLPLIVITTIIFLFRTSILSVVLLGIRKFWNKLTKKRISR